MREDIFKCVSNVDKILEFFQRCLLFGAGNKGMEVFEVLKKIKIQPVAFLDTIRSGFLADLPVYHPDAVPDELKNLPVIVSVFSCFAHCSLTNIVKLLKSSGFQNIISYEAFYCVYYNYFNNENYYWQSSPNIVREHEKDIMSVYDILSDDISRDFFQKQIQFRLTGDPEFIFHPAPVELQYFDPSVYSQTDFREFWDLGAFTGDTLDCASSRGVKFRRVIAFEPDMNNYISCCQYLKEHRKNFENAIALPLAVGSQNETLKFMESATTGSAVTEGGNASVPSIALDLAFADATPDFIKMDIEGSEYSALRGMKNILQKNRPLLAVCIYHRPSDIWEIPLFLHGLLKDYSFHIRVYGAHFFDTVLYAIPHKIRT